MTLPERLKMLRAAARLSQAQLALQLHVSRQAITKWENGSAMPDLPRAAALCRLYGIPLDSLFASDETCMHTPSPVPSPAQAALTAFLLRAKKATYAAKGGKVASSRPSSRDAAYEEGDYFYHDTYLGGTCFSGEEAVWIKGVPVWAMNYTGRVLGEGFSGDFLKEALLRVPEEYPYRGPLLYQQGPNTYHARIQGDFQWFSGIEEIFAEGQKVYEGLFHGGKVA